MASCHSQFFFLIQKALYLKLQLRTPQPKLAAWNSIRQSCHGLQPCFWVMKSFTPFDGDVLANESVIWDWWEHFTQRDAPGGEKNRANLWLCASCRSPCWFPAVYNETSCRAHGEWSAPPWLHPGKDTMDATTLALSQHTHMQMGQNKGLPHVIQRRREGGRVTQYSRLQ